MIHRNTHKVNDDLQTSIKMTYGQAEIWLCDTLINGTAESDMVINDSLTNENTRNMNVELLKTDKHKSEKDTNDSYENT